MENNADKKLLKKTVIIIVSAILLGLSLILGINAYIIRSSKDNILSPEEAATQDADCILVLGAGVWGNSIPSYLLEDRLLQGIALFNSGASDRLLMSGDHGREGYDEVNVMKQFAIRKGIPSENIFMDHAGFSTYESLYRVRDVFGAKRIIIVTQKYHMYRALFVAEKLGLDAYGVTSDQRQFSGQTFREAREILARVKDFFYVIITPEPTYLGEKIPLSGSGDLTNDR
ncbi:MAG: ElyC/SanA/YdcF family protein [Eubacteriales bacterium]|nr:ElyC/SanA/YdcF family protein [Eubacteriales bacterium]